MRTGADELIRYQDVFYILASSTRVDDRTRVLKHGDTFAVFDRFGDIAPIGIGELGVYHDGTRFVSRLALTLGGRRPLLLGSTVTEDSTRLIVDLTNPDLDPGSPEEVPRGILHLSREMLLWQGICHHKLKISNFGRRPVRVSLGLEVDADFADIFEVRGTVRARCGTRLPNEPLPGGLRLAYRGLDDVTRTLEVCASSPPSEVGPGGLLFDLELGAQEQHTIFATLACETGTERLRAVPFEQALAELEGTLARRRHDDATVHSSNESFGEWVHSSISDLHMMLTETPQGLYPYAGAPWFSTPFGRDGIITALEMLWINPAIARGVLRFLAAHQADHEDPSRDAEPGKILHEARGGEMAALAEVPFGQYYGSVDSTPLFVMLAGATLRHTGDLELAAELWPHVERAMGWMTGSGDPDGDGFLEYARRSATGLVQQGWKDSFDSVFHADGSLAEPPIALCEVQGYAFAAWQAAAELARALGRDARARELDERAERLRERFERAFWCEEIGCYALALDGAKRPCQVRASNAGHALWTGIAMPEHAARVVHTLLGDDLYSGFGVRTVSMREARYNPMSYHNGSVWPHDNAILAAGFARYGFHDAAARVLAGMFDASTHLDLRRMPELFCGFLRRPGSGPTLYPVACAPQSWSAGAVLLLIQACLGLTVDGARRRVSLHRPCLPESIDQLEIRGLAVGDSRVDLACQRHGNDLGVVVQRRQGPAEVLVLK